MINIDQRAHLTKRYYGKHLTTKVEVNRTHGKKDNRFVKWCPKITIMSGKDLAEDGELR